MAIHSSLVDPAAPVHLNLRMQNVLQSASVAKMSTITSCIVKSATTLQWTVNQSYSFRHYKSSKMIFYLDIFISGISEIEQSHLKITVCPRHRDLFGIRWRCNKTCCNDPHFCGDRCPQGKILSPKGSIWIYERHEYACTSRLA